MYQPLLSDSMDLKDLGKRKEEQEKAERYWQ